ncbi:hypothetical protein SCP_0109340 [Sparassis crispa]|uniref:Uncharacterized protein n=1 Tax=Sparassis crispa TaxID=139825 RepID=A0A401G7B1_9APHY|nr:hypothetical protein SCP_0109340 [Sparassis crispa]GBE78052.1 hypothetical protein SCP_0109340 [Sparassis crispa]
MPSRRSPISELFADEHARVTFLVPTIKAVMALARKPHQGPAKVEDGTIISEEGLDGIAKDNVQLMRITTQGEQVRSTHHGIWCPNDGLRYSS